MLEQEPRIANARTIETSKNTPLHLVARSLDENASEMAQLLLDYGADVNALSEGKFTPLTDAIFFGGTMKVWETLVDHGGKWSCISKGFDWHMLSKSVTKRDVKAVEYLCFLLHVNPGVTPDEILEPWYVYTDQKAERCREKSAKLRWLEDKDERERLEKEEEEWEDLSRSLKGWAEHPRQGREYSVIEPESIQMSDAT